MPIQKVVFAMLLAALVSSLGCSRNGMAVGGFSAYFTNPEDAQKIAMGLPKVVSHHGSRVEITPRHQHGDRNQVVSYTVDVQFGGKWDLKEDDDLIALVLKHITPSPAEIYAVRFPGLKHSQHKFDRQESIKAFWEYLWSRPHAGYSIEEVRQLLPAAQATILDVNVTSSQTFVLDWPHDERSLMLTFTYDDDKGVALLQSYGLGYPNDTKKQH